MKHKTIALFGIVLAALSLIALVRAELPEENPFGQIVQKLDEIKTTIENLQLNPTVTVENTVPVPNVTVNNEVSVPSVNVESPTVKVENKIPVPNVTVENIVNVAPSGSIVISLKCSWYSSPYYVMGSCIPPSCPEGFIDLGTGNVLTAVRENTVFGYSERWCAK